MPVTTMPIRAPPQAYAAGPVPARSCPPILYQLDQEAPPFVVYLDQRAPSPPRTKTSIFPADRDTAAGDEVNDPPRDFHDPQLAPSQCLYQRAWSAPCTKTSRLFASCAH